MTLVKHEPADDYRATTQVILSGEVESYPRVDDVVSSLRIETVASLTDTFCDQSAENEFSPLCCDVKEIRRFKVENDEDAILGTGTSEYHSDEDVSNSWEVKPVKLLPPCSVVVERLNLDDERNELTQPREGAEETEEVESHPDKSSPGRRDCNVTSQGNCFDCPHCPKKCTSRGLLTRHTERMHTSRQPTVCPICNKRFRHAVYLRRHLLSHDKINNFTCFYCRLRFPLKGRLKKHIVRAHLDTSLCCSHCDVRFLNKKEMYSHVREVHKDQLCPDCDRTFDRRNSLMRHIAYAHSVLLSYGCPHCNEQFKSMISLRAHINHNHDRKVTHHCPHCKKEFSRPYCLKAHISIVHDQKRNFSCPHCGRRFSLKGTMNQHIRVVHEKQKPHRCTGCEKSFSENGSLKKHFMVVHKKAKNFVCPICDARFGIDPSLRRHIKAVHLKQYGVVGEM